MFSDEIHFLITSSERVIRLMKNILVLTGSPRKGGNSDLMADAFIKELQNRGTKSQNLRLPEKRLVDARPVANAGA